MHGNAHDSWCIIFQTRFHLFIVHASFFHFENRKYAAMVFCILRNQKWNELKQFKLYPVKPSKDMP